MRIHVLAATALTCAVVLALGCSNESATEAEGSVSSASSSAGSNTKRGEALFSAPVPGTQGNGRACATCHVEEDGYQLTPAHVEAHYQALQAAQQTDKHADDPLFRSIDADDGNSDYTLLRTYALVKVTIPLPVDADGNKLVWPLDDPNATSVTLSRSVPSIRNTAFTAPYQLDGRVPTLEAQALGALHAHAQIAHDPNAQAISDIASFERSEFSSPGVALLANALATGQPPPDPDPPLNGFEAVGKQIFQGACAFCHGGPTQTALPPGVPGLQDIFVSKPLPPFAGGLPFPTSPPLPVRLWAVRVPGSDPIVRPSTDPGRALITGSIADFQAFDVPALYGISKTAPYFHDNSAASLNDVLLHYQALFDALRRVIPEGDPTRPQRLPDEAFPPLLAYLQKI